MNKTYCEKSYQELIFAYTLVVDTQDEKSIKSVVDELRAFEVQHGLDPYVIYGVGYHGAVTKNEYEKYVHIHKGV